MKSISRSSKIITLLVIDVIFFLVEIVVGYAVGSLALVADSFHMLNDILSLAVALYAIRLSSRTTFDTRYSYGWHRAEILAALVNGVFLLALCFSIFMEAIERFFSTPEISNPRLVVIVGSLGLASNILGLFIFNEHGHSHNDEDVINSAGLEQVEQSANGYGTFSSKHNNEQDGEHAESLYGHPAATRAYFVHAAHELQRARSTSRSRDSLGPSESPSTQRKRARVGSEANTVVHSTDTNDSEDVEQALLSESTSQMHNPRRGRHLSDESHSHHLHDANHINSKSRGSTAGHTHSHSMNMQALILHVFGDALGNVGVIATGLVIWLTTWRWRFYFDPIISLVIVVIIFSSALPLVKSASLILLQGVPSGISLEEVSEAIYAIDGVKSLHELHIWQLSESKIVASVHVLTSQNHNFMTVAAEIRRTLHDRGVHSSTIQPEFSNHQDQFGQLTTINGTACLIPCPPGQNCDPVQNACCPPPPAVV